MSMAATTGPTPKMSGQGRPRGRHRGADVRLGQLELVVDVNQFVGELAGETMPFDGGDTFGVDALEERESVADHDFFADPASDELGHQGVETTADLVPPPGQVGVILGHQTQHGAMVLDRHRGQHRSMHRRDRHRTGVVGIVLVRLTRRQHPHPGGQRGGNVQHHLAGSDKLLGQQIAQPVGRLDRPRPRLEWRRPRQQLLHLPATSPHPQAGQLVLGRVERGRGVRTLVRVDTNHHCSHRDPPRGR
jgi:hypothetical protein